MNSRFAAVGARLALLMATGTDVPIRQRRPLMRCHHDSLGSRAGARQADDYSVGNPGIPGKDNEGNTLECRLRRHLRWRRGVRCTGHAEPLGWALLQDIRKITDKPVRYVIASHYHADHIYGLQAFKDHTGAIIIAQERAGEYKENEETADEKADHGSISGAARCFPGWMTRPAW